MIARHQNHYSQILEGSDSMNRSVYPQRRNAGAMRSSLARLHDKFQILQSLNQAPAHPLSDLPGEDIEDLASLRDELNALFSNYRR